MASYDKHYKVENYFGDPYPELINVFDKYNREMKVLDLGCGQGRDSIAIGRLGFNVVGLDISEVGINQMNMISKQEGLSVSGLVGNYENYSDINKFDIILMDSMFHFYKKDSKKETGLLINLLKTIKHEAILILIVQYDKTRIEILHNVIQESGVSIKVLKKEKFIYKEFNSEFYMCIVQKNKETKTY